jgi:hypothetical protein
MLTKNRSQKSVTADCADDGFFTSAPAKPVSAVLAAVRRRQPGEAEAEEGDGRDHRPGQDTRYAEPLVDEGHVDSSSPSMTPKPAMFSIRCPTTPRASPLTAQRPLLESAQEPCQFYGYCMIKDLRESFEFE